MCFAAHDLRDASALGREQFGRRRIAGNVAHMEDEIIFMQPAVVELDQSRPRRARSSALTIFWAKLVKSVSQTQRLARRDERVPVAGKRQLEDHTQHAVIVVLDLRRRDVRRFPESAVRPVPQPADAESERIPGAGCLKLASWRRAPKMSRRASSLISSQTSNWISTSTEPCKCFVLRMRVARQGLESARAREQDGGILGFHKFGFPRMALGGGEAVIDYSRLGVGARAGR